MLRYLSLAVLVSSSLWVAGCQDNAAQDAKIAALNKKVNELEAQLNDRPAQGPAAKVSGVSGDVSDLRTRMDLLEKENAELKKQLAGHDTRFADVNKTLESLGGEVSATSAQQDREAKKKEMVELQAEIEKERREKRDAERKAQMDEWIARAKEAGIEIDPNDPWGSGMRAWQDPAQREKLQKMMASEFRKQRNANLKLDEATAQKLDAIEDDTMAKMQDINKRRQEGTITREQAQQEITQTMTDADNQAKNTLTEEQYKAYRESLGGMARGMGGMIPGMGGGGMPGFPGGGGGGFGGGRGGR